VREIDERAVQAARSEDILNHFLEEYESYILKCVSKTTGRYVGKSDDEWSVAIEAFCDAVKSYSYDKGSFLGFADLIIKRRLVDYYRKQNKYHAEYSVNPYFFSGEIDDECEEISVAKEIAYKTCETPDNSLKEEVDAASRQFSHYGFSFFDLVSCSPKSKKTKKACSIAVNYIISNPILLTEMRRAKVLPLKVIEKNVNIPQKILERHRKYIIAAAEILAGDYPCLAEYMWSIGKELEN